jgi:hypothetical protein
MNNCALLDYNPPHPQLHYAGNAQPAAGPGHPWPGLVGSGATAAGPSGENLRGFWTAYPYTVGCPKGRRCIRGAGQVQCDAANSAACSGCAFAKSALTLHLRQCHWHGPWPQAAGQNLFYWWAGRGWQDFPLRVPTQQGALYWWYSVVDGIFWHCSPAFGGRLHSSFTFQNSRSRPLWLLCLLCSPEHSTSGLDSICTPHCGMRHPWPTSMCLRMWTTHFNMLWVLLTLP